MSIPAPDEMLPASETMDMASLSESYPTSPDRATEDATSGAVDGARTLYWTERLPDIFATAQSAENTTARAGGAAVLENATATLLAGTESQVVLPKESVTE